MPLEAVFYCGWCGDGPLSIRYNDYCPTCHRLRDAYARIDSTWTNYLSVEADHLALPQNITTAESPQPTGQHEQSASPKDFPPSPTSTTSSIEDLKQEISSTYALSPEQALKPDLDGVLNSQCGPINKASVVDNYLFNPENPWSQDLNVFVVPTLPGQSSFLVATLEPATTPLRQPYSPSRRAQVAYVRNNGGACENCKKQKKACRHRLEQLEAIIDGNNGDSVTQEPAEELVHATHGRSASFAVNGGQDTTPHDTPVPYGGPSVARGSALSPRRERQAYRRTRARRTSASSSNISSAQERINSAASARPLVDHRTQASVTTSPHASQPFALSASEIGHYRDQESGPNNNPTESMHTNDPFIFPVDHNIGYPGPSRGFLPTSTNPSTFSNQQTFNSMPPPWISADGTLDKHPPTEADLPTSYSSSTQPHISQSLNGPATYNMGDSLQLQETPGLWIDFLGYPQDSFPCDEGFVSNTQNWTAGSDPQEGLLLTHILSEENDRDSLSQSYEQSGEGRRIEPPYSSYNVDQYHRLVSNNEHRSRDFVTGRSSSSGSYPLAPTPRSENTTNAYSGSNLTPMSNEGIEFLNDFEDWYGNDDV